MRFRGSSRFAKEEHVQDIVLKEVILTDEYHTMTYNEHYWTGYAVKEDPYVAPFYCCWDASYLYLYHLKPTNAE